MSISSGSGRRPGVLLAAGTGVLAVALAQLPALQRIGLSALPLAIVLGMLLGNTGFARIEARAGAGVDFARTALLRLGIVLFGFRLSVQEMLDVGWVGLLVAGLIVASVPWLALWLGRRLRLEHETSILIGAGAAICGAAAVMATAPVLRARPHQVSVAIATVVVFGTLGMFLYPLLYPLLQARFGIDAQAYGLYVGATVHEVAQVVVAGAAISPEAANIAVVEKMLRVILLIPFLLLLSALWRRRDDSKREPVVIPWFAILFLAVGLFNSLHVLPESWVAAIVRLDTLLLATAMAALGIRTRIDSIARAGLRPLVLATALFVWLLLGGLAGLMLSLQIAAG